MFLFCFFKYGIDVANNTLIFIIAKLNRYNKLSGKVSQKLCKIYA